MRVCESKPFNPQPFLPWRRFAPPFWTVTAVLELESADNLWVAPRRQGLEFFELQAFGLVRFRVSFILVRKLFVGVSMFLTRRLFAVLRGYAHGRKSETKRAREQRWRLRDNNTTK